MRRLVRPGLCEKDANDLIERRVAATGAGDERVWRKTRSHLAAGQCAGRGAAAA
jgi:hypothetical protein